MHIAINALHFHPGASGGAETYLLGLAQALGPEAGHHRVTLMIWGEAEDSIRPLCGGPVDYRIVKGGVVQRARRLALRLVDRSHPTGWLADVDADVVHYPNAVIWMRPFPLAIPTVLTMTDIQHEYYPEHWPATDVKFRRKAFPASVKQADAVIAISEFTRQGLIERLGCPADKVRTIYLGVDHALFSGPIAPSQWLDIKARYALPDGFLLYPAGTWPHKNHLRLLQALKVLSDRGERDITLVLTGIRQFSHEDVLRAVSRLGLQGRVLHLGHIPMNDLAVLLKKARGMVFPSLFEGFGLPVLEAMAAGCPVACSDRAALPEVAGQAALYFDPTEVDAIAEAILVLWLDEGSRERLIRAGHKRAAQFSWTKCAQETLRVYESLR